MRTLKQTLRARLRERRRNLTPIEQAYAAQKITLTLSQSDFFKKAQNIALYLPFDGEVSTYTLLRLALSQHKSCYAPIVANQRLRFVKIDLQTPLKANRFGILEPHYPFMKSLRGNQLDLVVLPLVGFDAHCRRLGMGGGYYDKAFAFRKITDKPLLIGLAYDFQKLLSVPGNKLDLLLDGVVTEKKRYRRS